MKYCDVLVAGIDARVRLDVEAPRVGNVRGAAAPTRAAGVGW
jgi:hypothetical protein